MNGDLSTANATPNTEHSSAFDLETSLTHLLHRASQCATEAFQDEVEGQSITARQVAVLHTVANNEGASQTDLVEMTGVDRSTIADIVRRMVERGWLERRRSREDARAYKTKLTPAGRDRLARAMTAAVQSDQRLLAALPAEQRDALIDTLRRIVSSGGKPEDAGA